MLKYILIQNIALIDRAEITLGPGLNVLTGETGAGKSIIIDSVNLVLGERADRRLIRTGQEKAAVEAVFDITGNSDVKRILDENDITGDDADTAVLYRQITASGKSVCRINGTLVPLALLKSVSDRLVDVHGQHEHQSLLNTSLHLGFLDKFAGEEAAALKSEVARAYGEWKETIKRMEAGFGSEAERERRLDIIRYQAAEIDAARLSPNEEEELLSERQILANAEKIMEALNAGYYALYAGGEDGGASAVEAAGAARSGLQGITALDERFAKLYERVSECCYMLEDVAAELRQIRDSFNFDPGRLEQVEQRLDAINKLKRKYGAGIPEILEYRRKLQAEEEEIINSAEEMARLEREKAVLEKKLFEVSTKLSGVRRKAAEEFAKKVLEELADLGLDKSSFEVNFSPQPASIEDAEFTADGFDRAEFLLSTNPGEPVKPLAAVASGGEMSRVMLALKAMLADMDDMPTLIFDEIDTGISGRMGWTVAKKLHCVAKARQVICVTHLAQIASMADEHLSISKEARDDRTVTTITTLDAEERVCEIARMFGGESEVGLAQARQMIRDAEEFSGKAGR